MSSKAEIFNGLEVPSALQRETLYQRRYERLEINKLEREKLQKIVEVLSHGELEGLVRDGYVTLAMIKPRSDHNALGLSDIQMAEIVESSIQKPLGIVFKISIQFGLNDVERFYAGDPKEAQTASTPRLYKNQFHNRWEEFIDLMTSGPTTFLLLFSPDQDAINQWRKQIGHWDVETRRDAKTIRGKFAKDNYTSIVHGSDAVETVLKEVKFLHDYLLNLYERTRS